MQLAPAWAPGQQWGEVAMYLDAGARALLAEAAGQSPAVGWDMRDRSLGFERVWRNWHSHTLLEGNRLIQSDGEQPTMWIHGLLEDVDPEDLSSTAGGSVKWFLRQTLARVQQGK